MTLKIFPIGDVWKLYSRQEKKNLIIYIIGIIFYKFGVEVFNGSIIALATNRYDQEAYETDKPARTFERVGLLTALNEACQCIGVILIAPITKHWRIHYVLPLSIFMFAVLSGILMILDAATGGYIKPTDYVQKNEHDFRYYGKYNTNGIIPIYCIAGIAYGMVELIRRIIPKDIVGQDAEKIRRMIAIVHIFFELTGVAATFTTALALIPRFGDNYAFIITPILFSIAGIIWLFMTPPPLPNPNYAVGVSDENSKLLYLRAIYEGAKFFIKSFFLGAKIIFSHRKSTWLWFCYVLTIYAHRFLENSIAPQIAKRYFKQSEWAQIVVGGSNIGETIGAIIIYTFGRFIKTPLPWSRLDALLLLIVWYIPFYFPPANNVAYAWIMAVSFIPIGIGAGTNDISLNTHIQSGLAPLQPKDKSKTLDLRVVPSFLYASYIIFYSVLNPILGAYVDNVYNSTKAIQSALINTVGIQLTIISLITLLATLTTKGAISCNPVFPPRKEISDPNKTSKEPVNKAVENMSSKTDVDVGTVTRL